MIPTQMHRLATRLGVRDGEAYTIVSGLVVALLLAAVGLPGVFRDFDPVGLGLPVGAQPTGQQGSDGPGDDGPTTDASAPDLPPFGSPVIPATPTLSSGAGDVPPPTVAPTAPPSTTPPRAPGDLVTFAELAVPASPDGVAIAPDGTVYVAGDDAGSSPATLWAFDAAGEPAGSWTAPDQPVARTSGLTGVAVAPDGTVLVVDAATSRILRLDRSAGALVVVARVPDIAACAILNLADPCEPGLLDTPPRLSGIAISNDGAVAVADRGQGIVWSLDGDRVVRLAAVADRLPGDGPVGLSYLYDGGLIVVTGSRLASLPSGLPAIFRIRPGEDTVEHVGDLGAGEIPGDIVASDSSRLYVTIPTAGLVADIGLDQGDRIDVDVAATDPTFRTPTGVALRDGALLVTDHVNRIFDLAVNDRPVT